MKCSENLYDEMSSQSHFHISIHYAQSHSRPPIGHYRAESANVHTEDFDWKSQWGHVDGETVVYNKHLIITQLAENL